MKSPLLISMIVLSFGLIPSQDAFAKIPRFMEIEEGFLYRGGQPSESADYDRLLELGIKTIINVRGDNSESVALEREEAHARGMVFIHIPMQDWAYPTEESLNKLYDVLAEMKIAKDGGESSVPLPAFVHCAQGRNRSGFFSASYRVEVNGWSYPDARQEMFDRGFIKRRYILFGKVNRLLVYLDDHYQYDRTQEDLEEEAQGASIINVTGPSFSRDTFMSAPNLPAWVLTPSDLLISTARR